MNRATPTSMLESFTTRDTTTPAGVGATLRARRAAISASVSRPRSAIRAASAEASALTSITTNRATRPASSPMTAREPLAITCCPRASASFSSTGNP
jgi:hypothetical protein